MIYSIGENIRIGIFGESHAEKIGVIIDGFPAGVPVDEDELRAFMRRRAPGGALATPRKEKDKVIFETGLADGVTTGGTITAVIYNTDARPGAYASLSDTPRPGHADYTARLKYGAVNMTGGGPFSGRMTAPLCIAGSLCMQWLRSFGVTIGAHIAAVHGVKDEAFDPVGVNGEQLDAVKQKAFPVVDDAAGETMQAEIISARENGNSVGGVIECAALGVPAGLGGPLFEGLESKISALVFGIPAVKGVEFGNGFACAELTGLENNDAFCFIGEAVQTVTNRCGGILGGIADGMPLLFCAAFKPTPSIAARQDTVNLTTKENVKISVGGRHDPCILPRAVPCVEAAAAVAIADILKGSVTNE